MRKRYILLLVLLALVAQVAEADTIHLKNGSILKGKVASFADEQFVVMLDTGSGRYLSRAMVYIGDVARIEFDGAPAASAEPMQPSTRPNDAPARVVIAPDIPRTNTSSESSRTTQPVETQPSSRETSPPDIQPAPVREKEREPEPQPEKPVATNSTPEPSEGERPSSSRKSAGPVRTVSVDIVGKRDWTSTGLIVKRGDRLRISATGTVTLDPSSGRTSGPEGTTELPDPKKLMPDQPTGALIGVIGADNDDFIFIGRSSEFTATRDGLLFLSVNEGTLGDNTGTYKAVIEVQARK
ncbi:MAG TPA: LecA/PA-IL family lectin [Blastocatellia bacterium]|nr:LecA/PA-IL family lectin [Blastocatellia bacterium]